MGALLVVLEWLALLASAAAVILLLGDHSTLDLGDAADLGGALLPALVISVASVVSFYYNDLYDLRIARRFRDFALRLLQAVGLTIVLLGFVYLLFPQMMVSRETLVATVGIMVPLTVVLRLGWYALLLRRPFSDRVLLLGNGRLAHGVAQLIDATPELRLTIVGCLEDEVTPGSSSVSTLPVLGSIDRLREIVREVKPDRIVVALTERRGRLPIGDLMLSRFAGILVEDGAAVYERFAGKLAIESVTPSSLVFSSDFKKSRGPRAMQRLLSLVAAAVGLVLTLPLMVLIGILIRLESRGPALFVQRRIGLNGRPFRLLKFRTMREAENGAERSFWVKDNEDRLTHLGRFLRRSRLDELPQFINVLRGDMNLVGPRPQPVQNAELFRREIPFYELRCVVRPGVTGWAQIRYGYANNLDEETEKMRYDLYYIKHMSLLFDLAILFETFKIMLVGRGAHGATVYEGQPLEGEAKSRRTESLSARP